MPKPPKAFERGKRPSAWIAFISAATASTFLSHSALANTTVSWTSATSGSWATPSLWSTNPNYPQNGTPTGAIYDTVISPGATAAFTLTLNSNVTVNTLTLNDANATLNQTAGTLSTLLATVSAGTYTLNGGTIASSIVAQGGGVFSIQNGTLNNVIIQGGDLQVAAGGVLNIQNGIAIANHNLDLGYIGAPTDVNFDGPSQSINNLNINTAGVAYIYSNGAYGSAATLTLGNGVVVNGGAEFENYNSDTLVNNGVISANSTYATRIDLSNFINNALTQATGGDELFITSNWTNNGTISATTGGIIYLGGTESNANLGNLTTDSTGNIYLNGTVSNGTINVGGGNISIYNQTLKAANITGGDLQVDDNGDLYIQNGITIADHNIDMNYGGAGAHASRLYFDGPSQSVNNLNINPNGYGYLYASGPTSTASGTLTLGSNVTIHGGAQFENYNTNDGLINNGIINADNATYPTSINLTNFINNGTAEATNGGVLYVNSSNWTSPAALTTTSTGTIYLAGECSGGTINIGSGNILTQGAILNAANVIGNDLQVSAGSWLYIQNGISIADHNLDLGYDSDGDASYLSFDGDSQSINNLNITPAGSANIYASGPDSGGAKTLTLGNNVTVHGGAQFVGYNGGDNLINNGTINGDSGTYSTSIAINNFTNNAIAEATNGGFLSISSSNWANTGTISALTQGTVYLTGNESGSGGTISTDATGTVYVESNIGVGTISGSGSLEIGSGVTLNVTKSLSQGSITSAGTLSATAGPTNSIGTIDGNGTLNITGTANLSATHIRQSYLSIGASNTATIAATASPGNTAATSVLTDLNNAGTLNLNNNDLIITDSTQYSAVKTAIVSAYDSGKWDKPGITSGSAAINSASYGLGYATATQAGTTMFDGQTVSGGNVLVKYTLLGDTQLRGTVGIRDYNTVLNNLGTAQDWSGGNFHFGSLVAPSDYSAVLADYGLHVNNTVPAQNPTYPTSDLKLEVNTSTGDVYLLTTTAVALTGYTISDPSAHLLDGSTTPDPAKLLSLASTNNGNRNSYEGSTTYANWFKIAESNTQLAEGQSNNSYAGIASKYDTITIPSGGTIDFGNIYNTTVNTQDITFDFAEAGTTPTNGVAYYGAEVDYVSGTPEPESGSVSILAIGAVGLLGRRRQRVANGR